MNPLAVYNAMYHDSRLKGTTMIIDLGAENTDLIIADGETIWLRSIPIGGNNFTEALVKSFKLHFAKAEDLKRNAATSKYGRQIFQAMRPVFADLVAEIQRSASGFMPRSTATRGSAKCWRWAARSACRACRNTCSRTCNWKWRRSTAWQPARRRTPSWRRRSARICFRWSAPTGWRCRRWAKARSPAACCRNTSAAKDLARQDQVVRRGGGEFVLGTVVAGGGYYLQQLEYDHNGSIRDASQKVLSDASALDQQWKSQVQERGGPDRQTINNVRTLMLERIFWPMLISDIFSALPPLPAGAGRRGAGGGGTEENAAERQGHDPDHEFPVGLRGQPSAEGGSHSRIVGDGCVGRRRRPRRPGAGAAAKAAAAAVGGASRKNREDSSLR